MLPSIDTMDDGRSAARIVDNLGKVDELSTF
jgi:hypothetical protein